MKTAEEWMQLQEPKSLQPARLLVVNRQIIRDIQLDAMKEGARMAAKVVDSLAKHNVGQDWQKEKRNLELYNMGIGQEQAGKAILTNAERWTTKDL